MKFERFLQLRTTLQEAPLGGLDAQLKMVPPSRKDEKLAAISPTVKKAAVLALFYPEANGDAYIALTLRAQYKGKHSAQVSFPGGKVEPNDPNLAATALRELEEEVGIAKSTVTILKEMTDVYIPPSNFLVTPFLGYLIEKPVFHPNTEVQKMIPVPIANLIDETFVKQKKNISKFFQKEEIPYFDFNGEVVWGATAMIISEIKELIKNML